MNTKPIRYRYDAKIRNSVVISHIAKGKSLLLPFWELTKPRLSLLSVITAVAGYLAALPEYNTLLLASFIVGTILAAGGTAALNQLMERKTDAKMKRTRKRPLPVGSVSPRAALICGVILCLIGNALLWLGVNSLAALLAVTTEVSYLALYTPLKKHTSWSTEIGAIPGAIPPLIGWAAAEGRISTLGWILFAILFFWQIPHFMAIAWIYRNDYTKVGFPIGSAVDPSGQHLSRKSFAFTVLLLISSLLPTALGYTTLFYALITAVAGAYFLYQVTFFMFSQDRDAMARKIFFTSLVYLPLLLGTLVVDRMLLIRIF